MSTDTKFKYMDRVEIVQGFYRGRNGTVVEHNPYSPPYTTADSYRLVDTGAADVVWVDEANLRLLLPSEGD